MKDLIYLILKLNILKLMMNLKEKCPSGLDER